MIHYHVTRHSEDEDPYVTSDLFAALDYAKSELDELADMEHGVISEAAQRTQAARDSYGTERYPGVYEMESALLSFVKMERYGNLVQNAGNMVKQNAAKITDRAPLYQPDWTHGEDTTASGYVAVEAAEARLLRAAKHVAQMINGGSPIKIWECSAELRTWPEEDRLHGGEDYCADEYPDGYGGDVDTDPTGRDEPAGDH